VPHAADALGSRPPRGVEIYLLRRYWLVAPWASEIAPSSTPKQRWSWVWHPDGDDPRFANIRNQCSGLDLNVAGGSGAYGAKLIQWAHVAHTPNALFTFAAKETVD
jgi:hypothetical protein